MARDDGRFAQLAEHSSLFGLAIVVGLVAGAIAVAFQKSLASMAALREGAVASAGPGLPGVAVAVIVSAVAVAAGAEVVRRFAPSAAGSGIPQVEVLLHRGGDMSWTRVLWVKFVGGLLAIGGGLTLGREGPTVQMGAAAGRAFGGPPGQPGARGHTLIAAGAGAGLAAAFNAPLAGTVFVLEEMRVLRTPRHALAALLAAVTADQVCRALVGSARELAFAGIERPPMSTVPLFLALGAAAGLVGALFNRWLLGCLALFDRLRRAGGRNAVAVAVAAGAAVGLTGFFAPELLGPGDGLVERALHDPPAAAGAAATFVSRFALTLVSYATGVAGGLFAPLLVLGSELGVLAGRAGELLLARPVSDLPSFAVVGMGALFAASVRAPATGVLIIVEMTGALPLTLPLVYAVVIADLTARALGARPIYEALLDRTIAVEGRTP